MTEFEFYRYHAYKKNTKERFKKCKKENDYIKLFFKIECVLIPILLIAYITFKLYM